MEQEGFFADPVVAGQVLMNARMAAVGLANNVNYGEAAILASIARLDALGIVHAGAGANRDAARAPAFVACGDLRLGFLQYSAVYWRTNHEAGPSSPGIAVMRANTAYQVPEERPLPGYVPMNRPGLPPVVITWADPAYLAMMRAEIGAARAASDFVVVACHWGLGRDGARLHDRDRPRGDRRRCRHGGGPRPTPLPAGRTVSRQTHPVRAGQLLVPIPAIAASSTATGSG